MKSPPPALDWRDTFFPVWKIPLHPYSVKTFINIPWIVFVLYPFHFFSEKLSLAMNASLNFIVIGALIIKRKGNFLSVFLTFTSLPFIALIINGTVEWIPALGFLLPNGLGLSLVLMKPQSGILGAFSWFSKTKNKILFLLPAALIILFSFVLWGNWLGAMALNYQYVQIEYGSATWNYSLFPWTIPVGLGLIFYIVKYKPVDGELLGTLATLCMVPYFALHSLIIFVALLNASHFRIAALIWCSSWLLLIFVQVIRT